MKKSAEEGRRTTEEKTTRNEPAQPVILLSPAKVLQRSEQISTLLSLLPNFRLNVCDRIPVLFFGELKFSKKKNIRNYVPVATTNAEIIKVCADFPSTGKCCHSPSECVRINFRPFARPILSRSLERERARSLVLV